MLRKLRASSFVIAFCLLSNPSDGVLGQETGKNSTPEPRATIRAISERVLLDLIVRDEDGRPVTDLRADEIEVYEDGVKQEVLSFRFLGSDVNEAVQVRALEENEGEVVAQGSEKVPFDPFKNVNLVALVFERLPDTARHMARQAALHFLETGMGENTLVAVFAIDNRLYALQEYTNDREALRKAILGSTSGAYGMFDSQSTDAVQGQLKEIADREKGDRADMVIRGVASQSPDMALMQEVEIEELTVNILRQAEKMMLYQRGHATITALRALVQEEGRLAGRKTLVLFSTGIQVPHPVVNRFRMLISEANRANVSIYSVDARGLTPESNMADSQFMLSQATEASRTQMLLGVGHLITRDETMISEYAETAIRMNGVGTLDDLAQSTGGFLVANTNDPRELIDKVSEDIKTYYEVSYSPTVADYDGKFRTISVKISRPGIKVQSRSGYFALPPATDSPIKPFEIPMLVALNSGTLPKDFEHRSRILRFPDTEHHTRHVIIVEVPLSTFLFTEDEEEAIYNTRFSILTILKDQNGKVVERFSQDYPLQGPLDKVGMVKAGSVVFMREALLERGIYTLESAVVDQLSQLGSTRRTRLVVGPSRSSGLNMSSLSIVRRVDPVPEGEAPDNPFVYQGGRIVPNLGGSVVRDPNSGVGIYCVIYPSQESAVLPELIMDVLQNGKLLARGTPDLPPVDDSGAIKFVGTVPVDGLEPGRYEVRAYVSQGKTVLKEHAFFSLSSLQLPPDPELE